MTSLSHAYRSVSGGICEMFYSFSTAHCKTRSYKGMETMNARRVGGSSNLWGERLKLLSLANSVHYTIYTLLASMLAKYNQVPKTC